MNFSQAERDADFLARRSGPGVFYATGNGETQVGTTQNGRRIVPAEWGLINSGRADCGDGKGAAWVEHDPDLALSSGGVRGIRKIHRLGGNSDWNIRPWGHMPLNWREDRVNGLSLPVATNTVDPALPRSRWNSKGLTVARHFFYSVSVRAEEAALWERPTYWLSNETMAEFDAKGARPGLHQNKLLFITGGQSSDQVAVTWKPADNDIHCLFYDGNSTNGFNPTLVKGLMQPDRWITFQLMFSDQIDAAANDDKLRRAEDGALGFPRFVALWGAPYGEAPQLIGYTNCGDDAGPAMVPSRLTDDRPLINKRQDANGDDYASDPNEVLGAAQGFPEPTRESFYIARNRRAMTPVKDGGLAVSTRYFSRKNAHWRAGRLPNYGAGHPLAFTSGALAGLEFLPTHRVNGRKLNAEELRRHKQYEIASTEYAGRSVVINGEDCPVHLVRLAEIPPIAPAAGDGVIIGLGTTSRTGTERLRHYPDARMYYAEPTLSTRWIPFPHQPDVPMPRAW